MAGESRKTVDHQEIKKWVEARGGRPATVKGTEGIKDAGVLRIDFPDRGEDNRMEPISWDEFFKTFDEKSLAFLFQEKTRDGKQSRFSKFVSR
jgi:hypothetical protein